MPQRAIQTSRRASCHLSISSLQVLFTLLPPSPPVYTNCFFFPNPPSFCSARLYVVAETRERGPWDLQTPNLLLSLGCQGYCCHFNLRYDNCTIYTRNSSIRSVLAALCSTSLFYLCHTDSLPLQWFLHPDRIDGNKTLHQPWVIHANCILWNIDAVTFLNKNICLYPPSADFCWSQRKNQVSRWRAWRSLAVMLTFTSLPNSVSCVWEGSAASRGNTCMHPPNRLWVESCEWAAIWHRSNNRTTQGGLSRPFSCAVTLSSMPKAFINLCVCWFVISQKVKWTGPQVPRL